MLISTCILCVVILPLSFASQLTTSGEFSGPDSANATNKCLKNTDEEKIDCLPTLINPSEHDCAKKNQCCWQVPVNQTQDTTFRIPSCYYSDSHVTYEKISERQRNNGMDATFRILSPSGFEGDAQKIRFVVRYLSRDTLRIKIEDVDKKRYETPLPEIHEYPDLEEDFEPSYQVYVYDGKILIMRKSTGEILFDTTVGALIFSDQYLELSTRLTTSNFYGLGEHSDSLMRGGTRQKFTLFNRGALVPNDRPGFNLYGSHAFYLNMEKSNKAHGVYLRNSNAMDLLVYEAPQLTYRVIGGLFDFFFFMGPDPNSVISQYTTLIGKPFLPPYWSLGFHLCKYQYHTTNETRNVWKRNVEAGIPFDTQWSDIDYMEDYKCFTVDSKGNYAGLTDLVEEIHKANMKYVMITDPGLSSVEAPGSYPPYDDAKALDILIKNDDGDILEAMVWQNITAFVDFSHPKASDYWIKQYKHLHDLVPYDGAWIDMNEPYSFVSGSHKGCPQNNTLDYPPYVPGFDPLMFTDTICMSGKQHIGEHYYAHNLYSTQEGILTNRAMRQILGKRPFVLSRSTFPGYGHFGAHWIGDVGSTWYYIKESIQRMLTFNMYGIPMVGSDICGFVGNTTFDLCRRWTQLGAFYPFARNHNDKDTVEQDPAYMGPEMIALAKEAYGTRYYLLPYLYTLFYKSSIHGSTVARPLFFEFPSDQNTRNIDTTFLWGKALMIIPVLEENKRNVTTYVPNDVWYDFYTGAKLRKAASFVTFDASTNQIPLLLRGGHILPAQETATNTFSSRKNGFHLLVALDSYGEANGELYWDDGDSNDNADAARYNKIRFEAFNDTLTTTVDYEGFEHPMVLSKVIVYGLKSSSIQTVLCNELSSQFSYETDIRVLRIDLSGSHLLKDNRITWK